MNIKLLLITGWEEGAGKNLLGAAYSHWLNKLGMPSIIVNGRAGTKSLRQLLNINSLDGFDLSGHKAAQIDGQICIHCNLCKESCKFSAIDTNTGSYRIRKELCQGCGHCIEECPLEAITHSVSGRGNWFYGYNGLIHLVDSKLSDGSEQDLYLLRYLICNAIKKANNENIINLIVIAPINDKAFGDYLLNISDMAVFVIDRPVRDDLRYIERMSLRENSNVYFVANRVQNVNEDISNHPAYIGMIPLMGEFAGESNKYEILNSMIGSDDLRFLGLFEKLYNRLIESASDKARVDECSELID